MPKYDVSPELQAALEREKQIEDSRSYSPAASSSGSSFWKPRKPKTIGETVENIILVLPLDYPMTQPVPWIKTAQHSAMRAGQFSSIICPAHDARMNDEPARPCLICDEKDRRFAQMREHPKGSPQSESAKREAQKLNERDRFFMHVFDLQDPSVANWDAAQGKAVPAIWGISRGQRKELEEIIGQVGMFWHPDGLTPIKVNVTKDGPEDKNIKYDMRVVIDQVGSAQLPPGWEGALQNLGDLNSLRKLPTDAEMQAFLGVPATPAASYAPGAPPNPYAAPVPAAPAMHVPPAMHAMPVAAMAAVAAPPPVAAPPTPPPVATAPAPPVPPGPPAPPVVAAPPPQPPAPPEAPPVAPSLPAPPVPPSAPPVPPAGPSAAVTPPGPPSLPPPPAMPTLPKPPGS